MRIYKAIVWGKDPEKPGQRVELLAESLDDAKKQLIAEYGEDCIYTLHNEEDASRPR